jgi:hypothetical protein
MAIFILRIIVTFTNHPTFPYRSPKTFCFAPHVVRLKVKASVEPREERGAALGEVRSAIEATEGVVLDGAIAILIDSLLI